MMPWRPCTSPHANRGTLALSTTIEQPQKTSAAAALADRRQQESAAGGRLPLAAAMASIDLEQYKDLDRAIEQLLQCKPLSEAEVKELCAKAQNVFVNESNVQPVAAPVTVRPEEGRGD